MKYSPQGGPIHVQLGPVGDGLVRLRITDSGIGMSPDELAAVFEPYQRADRVVGQIAGHGLGLTSVRQIVSEHGGRVWAESAGIGSGTTVTVEIPIDGATAD